MRSGTPRAGRRPHNRKVIDVRSIRPLELQAWARLHGNDGAEQLADAVGDLWKEDTSRAEWCFVAERPAADGRGMPVARIGFAAEPIGAGLETLEFRVMGLWLPWDGDYLATGRALLDATLPRVLPPGEQTLDLRLNSEIHDHIDERRRFAEASGFALFQEKHGHYWRDDGGPMPEPQRLRIRTLTEVGRDAYRAVMARSSAVDSLDRNDRYYYGLSGPDAWAGEMIGFLEDGDEDSWLYAETQKGEPVGFAALGTWNEGATGTIVHIGVVPEHRGRGYVNELLRAVNVEARRRGFTAILSDVDVENGAMSAALTRAGHSPDARDWHVWHYRLTVAG